ncbi:MAG: FtsX-like permease family protein [Pseudomonadales bacterium]|nr:FtsX-like permease family protein [Pseudomonadales bacterium]
MFSTYLKIAYRRLLKEKGYSLINIAGLSLGLACALILGLYLQNALSYDSYHENKDRSFRLVNEFGINGNVDFFAINSTQAGRLMQEQFSEIEAMARFNPVDTDQVLISRDDNQIYWPNIYRANNDAFTIFSHDVIYGNQETALTEPNTMAVSESFAREYFGETNPIGELLESENETYRIDLVYGDQPGNTHFKYSALLSYDQDDDPDPAEVANQLWNVGIYTYLMFGENYDSENFAALSDQFVEENMMPFAREVGIDATVRFFLEPLTDIHLTSITTYDQPRGNIFYIYAFAAILVFVLIVASINYMNLATARATKRAKEVGMRKVIGANRSQLIWQFVGESVFYVVVSLLIALVMVYSVINFTAITQLFDSDLQFESLFRPANLALILLGTLILGIVSGVYPAFYLSSIVPMAAFKGSSGTGAGGSKMREGLVLIQFVISVGVITSTLFMLAQMNYVQSMDLGFEKDNKILVRVQGADRALQVPELKNELLQIPGVNEVATTFNVPGTIVGIQVMLVEDNEGVMSQQTVNRMTIGFDFIEALEMEVVAGRAFDDARETDRNQAIIVNEALVTAMGWENPIGKLFNFVDPDAPDQQVIGVVKNFHYAGMQEEVVPKFLNIFEPDFADFDEDQRRLFSNQLVVSVEEGTVSRVTEFLEQRWLTFDNEHPFEFTLLDDLIADQYGSENRLMQLIGVFAAVCIFISCLGLYGLSSFNTAQRTKEIGVRKVLGASAIGIILLLFKKVLVLVALASAIASVASFFAVSEWLQGFYYRIDILGLNSVIFVLAAAVAIVIAFTTMALQSYRTAQSNPVKSLRYE